MRVEQTIVSDTTMRPNGAVLSFSKKDCLANLSCTVLLLFAFLPIFNAFLGRWINYVKYIAILGFLFGVFLRDRRLFCRITIVLAVGFLFNLYYYYQLFRLSTTFPSFMARSMLSWVYACLALYYGEYGGLHGKKRILALWMLILVVTSITTIVSLAENPIATRVLANANIFEADETISLYLRNTASWGIMYGMAFTLPMWIAQFKRTKNPWHIVVIVLVTACTVISQITYAIILAVVFLLSFFLHRLNMKKFFILIVVLVILMPLILSAVAGILYMIYKNIDVAALDVVKTRVYQLYLLFDSGQATGDANIRLTLYSNSLMTFLRDPIFGHHIDNINENIIGMHSQILDIMAATGILGLVTFLGIYGYVARKAYTQLKGDQIKMYFIIGVVFLTLFMFVNPVWYAPESFMSVFFLPALIDSE